MGVGFDYSKVEAKGNKNPSQIFEAKSMILAQVEAKLTNQVMKLDGEEILSFNADNQFFQLDDVANEAAIKSDAKKYSCMSSSLAPLRSQSALCEQPYAVLAKNLKLLLQKGTMNTNLMEAYLSVLYNQRIYTCKDPLYHLYGPLFTSTFMQSKSESPGKSILVESVFNNDFWSKPVIKGS